MTINALPNTDKRMNLGFITSNTNMGIPPARHSIIFNYKQASSDTAIKYGGNSFGFTNGTLIINNEIKDRTKYAFLVPFDITGSALTPKKAEASDDSSPSLEGKKILVAEDNKINFFVVNKFLTGWGVKVTHAENGQFALDKLAEDMFDLILMDLQMPVMDGIEASRIIRNSEKQDVSSIPIIALTAALISENQEKFADLLINDYVLKPFKPQDLFERINRHIR